MKQVLTSLVCTLALTLGACDSEGDEPSDDSVGDAGSEDGGGDPFDDGGNADDGGDADDGGNADDGGAAGEPTFGDGVASILAESCGCHGSGAGGLAFDGDPYGALVEVPAVGADMNYVEPGDVEGSYLVHKIRGTQGTVGGSGSSMPPGGTLSEERIETIEAWIEAGAPE